MARTLIASDDFNRAGPGLGSNWANLSSGRGDVVINSSTRVTGQFGALSDDHSAARWVGTGTFTDDQYASVKVQSLTSFAGGNDRVGVIVRASADTDANRDYYLATADADSATSTHLVRLAKWVNGTFTALHSANATLAEDDRLELEAEGTEIRVCVNGTPLGGSFTVTDSDISTGKPGVAAAGNASCFGDDWQGGNITAAAGPTLTSPVGTATGKDAATVGATTDTASGTLYAVVSSSATVPTGVQIEAGQDHTGSAADAAGNVAVASTGAKTIAVTGISSDVARYAHLVHKDGSDYSNIVTSASFACQVLALTGSLSAQSGTDSGSLTWTGATPASLVTGNGVGSRTWTIFDADGSGLSTINGTSGVVSGTLPAAGTYDPVLRVTDSSSAGSEAPQTEDISFNLIVSAAGTAPSITIQPVDQTVAVPNAATFSVSATGSGTLTYQWRRNGVGIGGATSSSYTTPATTVSGGSANDGDVYDVVVSGDTAPAATSDEVLLTVNPASTGQSCWYGDVWGSQVV